MSKPVTFLGFQLTLGLDETEKNGRLLSFTLFLLIIFSLLLCIGFSMSVYQTLVKERSDAAGLRAQTSLLVNAIRSNDEADALTTGTGPEGPSLVLVEHLGSRDYETRLYLLDGAIVEEYAPAGSDYDPERAETIVASSTFSFEIEENLVSITTDAGTAHMTMRSADPNGGE